MFEHFTVAVRGWVAPAAVGKTVLVEGGVLFVKCDKYYTGSLSLYAIPVCWLPESFLAKDVDRYIVRIDDKRVNIKAGLKERLRRPGSDARPARRGVPIRSVA